METQAETSASSSPAIKPTGCCPPFQPSHWDGKEFHWKDKPFVKDHVTSVFHIPLNFGSKVLKNKKLIDAAGAGPEEPMMLAEESSPWGSELFIDIKKPVPGAQMATLSGTFLTKVFEGPFKDEPKWADEMKAYVAEKGKNINALYFGYTTCPACAKAYGKNYVVVFARVDEPAVH